MKTLPKTYFAPLELLRHYKHVRKKSRARGLDRLSAYGFRNLLRAEFQIIRRKALNKTYRFTPYKEVLLGKGRGKVPRVVSVPTVRDRITLRVTKDYLQRIFPSAVNTDLPNAVIRSVHRVHQRANPSIVALRIDVRGFYDNIDQSILLKKLSRKARSQVFQHLIRASIECPTFPPGRRKGWKGEVRRSKGIPQGLPISNALANVYLETFDKKLERIKGVIGYWRYVDDILVLVTPTNVARVKTIAESDLGKLGLEISLDPTKYHEEPLSVPFTYLGYQFDHLALTVPEGKVSGLVDSVARFLTWYRHNRDAILHRCSWLSADALDSAFVEDLNERITGAVFDGRLFGWLPYYQALTDRALLHRTDATIRSLLSQSPIFGGRPPKGLKRLTTAYYKIRSGNAQEGYLRNYDVYNTVQVKLTYLTDRGILDTRQNYSPQTVTRWFSMFRQRNLRRLVADEGPAASGN
ncbi:MAG TPA: reverse transcriptase domain-containing protein [Trueperaceae bacterium]